MAIIPTKGDFIVVGLNTASPKFFWKGIALTEVRRMVAHHDDDVQHVKLNVDNTTTFDSQYEQMRSAGIKVKKGG